MIGKVESRHNQLKVTAKMVNITEDMLINSVQI
jgi:hypothetical protein